jgi:hypothetical protein
MDEALFEDALVNRYDVATCDGMQQAAEASWKAIFGQLNLSDSELASVVSNQNETLSLSATDDFVNYIFDYLFRK